MDSYNYLSIHNFQKIPRVRIFPQLFKNFSKTLVYVYRYAFKSFSKVSFSKVFQSQGCTCTHISKRLFFLKVSFLKESLSKNVYVYRGEQMFEKSNKISDRLFYYISNAYIL